MMQPNPIQRFLGLPRGAESPFELLGLTPAMCDERAVREALRSRLERVRRHPESLSHEADEVRLALHAAAAQLLDPEVRAHLVSETLGAGMERPAHARQSPFRNLAAHVLANAGGWNRRSQRWLAMLAHAHGIDDRRLQEELRAITAQRRARSAPPMRTNADGASVAATARPRRTVYEQIHGVRRPPRPLTAGVSFWLIGAAAAVAVVSGVLLLHEAAPKSDVAPEPSVESPRAVAAPAPSPPEAAPPVADAAERAERVVEQIRSPEMVLRWLAQASDEYPTDPGQAAWRFERAVEALSRIWPEMNAGVRRQANAEVLTFAHQMDIRSVPGRRAMEAIERGVHDLLRAPAIGAESVYAAVWSGAILAIMCDDQNADERVRRQAAETWRKLGAAPQQPVKMIESAIGETLPMVAAQLVARMTRSAQSVHESAWQAWTLCLQEYVESDRIATARHGDLLAMRAAEQLLISDVDVASDERARDALFALLSTARWTAQPEPPVTWEILLAWFEDVGVPTSRLAVATEWVVEHSGAPGVSSNYVLSRGSIPEARQNLRARYARLWSLDAAGALDGFAGLWSHVTIDSLRAHTGGALSDRLGRAALLARLNAAAALKWRGETEQAHAILMDPSSPITRVVRGLDGSKGSARATGGGADGLWAARFLAANTRDIDTRVALLAEAGRFHGELGPVDADVLVEAALRSPANEIRTRAQEVVRRRTTEPGVVSSVLEVISHAPDTASTRALISDVTGVRLPLPAEPTWESSVRLALIERLLGMLAPDDELARADAMSVVLMRAYADRVRRTTAPGSADSFQSEFADSVEEFAAIDAPQMLWRQWLADARALAPNPRAPIPIEEIARRCDGRLQLARGPMQRFAALQWSITEAMAFVITAERPSRAPAVHDVIRRGAADRRSASTIVDQIVASEQAMLALWAIRFGVGVEEVLPDWTAASDARDDATIDQLRLDIDALDQEWWSTAPIPNLRERLQTLSPKAPLNAFELAEELAAECRTPQGHALARRLFAMSYAWDVASDTPRKLGASVCLALAELSRRDDERRWLLALAVSLDPLLARTIALPDAERADAAARLAAAQGLELYRHGDYREALELLQRPETLRVIESYGAMLPGGAGAMFAELTSRPNCRECRNRRIVTDAMNVARLCPTCDGDPGPRLTDAQLVDHLRLERLLLSDEPSSWSAALLATRGAAMRDVDPTELARTGR